MHGISAAPLGLKNPSGNRSPRPMAWADIELARWAGAHSCATRTMSRPARTHLRYSIRQNVVFRTDTPAIQAQRAVSMSAQGNALGWASHADQSPKGAALFNWDRTCIENRNRAFRAAPLGLKNPSGNRVPRPMAWADIGLARWAEMQSHATRTNSRPAGTQRREHHDVP